MNTLFRILTVTFLIGGMISTPHLFIIIRELKSKGIQASYLMWFPSDIIKFKTLMKNEENDLKKQDYMNTYYWFLIPFIVSITSFIGIGIYAFLS